MVFASAYRLPPFLGSFRSFWLDEVGPKNLIRTITTKTAMFFSSAYVLSSSLRLQYIFRMMLILTVIRPSSYTTVSGNGRWYINDASYIVCLHLKPKIVVEILFPLIQFVPVSPQLLFLQLIGNSFGENHFSDPSFSFFCDNSKFFQLSSTYQVYASDVNW